MTFRANPSRRGFLQLAGAGATVVAGASISGVALARPTFPTPVGSKFYPNGMVKEYPGNTILCHLPQQGPNADCFNVLLDIYRTLPLRKFARKVALLPPSSYHMTVFDCSTDKSRNAGNWPSDLSRNAPIEECDRFNGERLKSFDPAIQLPIRMKINTEQTPPDSGNALTFKLLPADDAEERKLRGLRDRLAELLKFKTDNHDSYRFHISLGYPIAWFDNSEIKELSDYWQRWVQAIASRAPEIHLNAPEYCTFRDMFAFYRQLYLGGTASPACEPAKVIS